MTSDQKCTVVVLGTKPRITSGKYNPEDQLGVYGNFKKSSFGIPKGVKAVTRAIVKKTEKPLFIVDPDNALAQPVGKTSIEDPTLAASIEIAGNKKYVKALTVKVLDTMWILISMGAGVGVTLAALILLSSLSGHPITFGAGR